MRKRVLICTKIGDKGAADCQKELTQWLRKKSIDVLEVTHSKDTISAAETKGVVLGVVMGGDGTFLTLVRKLESKGSFPLLGINLGSLGFITEVSRDEMLGVVDKALKNKLSEENRPLLDVDLWRGKKKIASGSVFNDAVITKNVKTTMLKFDVTVGGEFLHHVRADGYIVSTPTGSTAYALSAGGPLVHPEIEAIVLVPICSHALSARPILVPLTGEISIEMQEPRGSAFLVYDGQFNFELEQGDVVKISLSKNHLRLARPPRQKWSEALREKLRM